MILVPSEVQLGKVKIPYRRIHFFRCNRRGRDRRGERGGRGTAVCYVKKNKKFGCLIIKGELDDW